MAKYKIGDVVRVEYGMSGTVIEHTVRAVLSAGTFSPELGFEVGANAYVWEEKNGEFAWDTQKYIDNENNCICTLVSREAAKQETTLGTYPHTCDYCGSPCWNGMNFNCSNPNCITKG